MNGAWSNKRNMEAQIKTSSEALLEKALESLRRTEILQRDWMIWGVDCVCRHVEGVDGDWLEKWGEDEENEERAPVAVGS
jgi:hypothetical protein